MNEKDLKDVWNKAEDAYSECNQDAISTLAPISATAIAEAEDAMHRRIDELGR